MSWNDCPICGKELKEENGYFICYDVYRYNNHYYFNPMYSEIFNNWPFRIERAHDGVYLLKNDSEWVLLTKEQLSFDQLRPERLKKLLLLI